ncbi:uncharacterized protein LOC108025662 [Drosophila biarmipes]|uniref:uncharacterized protein LOC108025662 n=1 Tax=Drosophila biarmipes TaxID=125945 RepID=UPI0007E6F54C|nr:uncharacterized protein LOC108025662 [Drosophila biarmipes]
MLHFGFLFWSSLILLGSRGSLGDSQDNGRTVYLLNDPENQCGKFCLSALQPMIDLGSETSLQLRGIQGEQQSTQMKLVAMKSRLEAQRLQILKSLDRLPSTEDLESALRGTEERLMKVNFELKNQLLELESKGEGRHTEIRESLRRASIQEDFQATVNRTEEQTVAINLEMQKQRQILQDNLEEEMHSQLDSQLDAVHNMLGSKFDELLDALKSEMEGHLKAVRAEMKAQFQLLQDRLEDQSAPAPESSKKSITSEDITDTRNQLLALLKSQLEGDGKNAQGFEKIGTRYFRIEDGIKMRWSEAADSCKAMGGHLAAIRDQEELDAISAKLKPGADYWLGINDKDAEGEFVSLATKKAAPFLKWRAREPNDYEGSEDGVLLRDGEMNDAWLNWHHYYICQADDNV